MSLTGSKIASKYIVGPKIGSGSFGEVYVVNLLGSSELFALKKVEDIWDRKIKKLKHHNSFTKVEFSSNSKLVLVFLRFNGKEHKVSATWWLWIWWVLLLKISMSSAGRDFLSKQPLCWQTKWYDFPKLRFKEFKRYIAKILFIEMSNQKISSWESERTHISFIWSILDSAKNIGISKLTSIFPTKKTRTLQVLPGMPPSMLISALNKAGGMTYKR